MAPFAERKTVDELVAGLLNEFDVLLHVHQFRIRYPEEIDSFHRRILPERSPAATDEKFRRRSYLHQTALLIRSFRTRLETMLLTVSAVRERSKR